MVYRADIPRQLLGVWRDILDDIRRLCHSLEALPDASMCGKGAAHLGGWCPCCGFVHSGQLPGCTDCERLLADLVPTMDALIVDTMRFCPVVNHLLQVRTPQCEGADGSRIERDVVAIYRTFAQLIVAADDFRVSCRTSHLKTLKARAYELSVMANQLDRTLDGGGA